MKIAQIAPIIERVPPKKYGGTERTVHALTEELVRRGHDVTLFASGDSLTSAKLISIHPRGLREAKVDDLYGPNIWSMLNIGMAYAMLNEFDIIHEHNFHLSMPTANIAPKPVVMTLHNAFTPASRRLFEALTNVHLVAVSNSQRAPAPHLNYAGTVYHGLEMEQYPFSEEHDNYLLFVGRINPDKGVHHAIEVANYVNLPLIIAAKLDDIDRDMQYFHEYVEPRLSDQVRWVGEVDQEERNRLMSRALCMLHPVCWREPFGLTLIESMACGAPVIAFNRGSIPEIIRDGKTGFIVEDVEEMIEALDHVNTISRQYCRTYALDNFNAKKMADGYEKIYDEILNKGRETSQVLHAANGNGKVKEKRKSIANVVNTKQ